jgi:two-component system NtrC family sensor kinase
MLFKFMPVKKRLYSAFLTVTHLPACFTIKGVMVAVVMLLIFSVSGGYAQDTTTLKAPTSSVQKGLGKLKLALTRNVATAADAKALIETARALNYPAGQAVALCHLAIISEREQQPAQWKPALRDAARFASKITNVDDAEWALDAISDLQEDHTVASKEFNLGFTSVMALLGKFMAKEALGASGKELSMFVNERQVSAQIDAQVNKVLKQAYKSAPRVPGTNGIKSSFADHWLDTMLNTITGSSRGTKKLVIQKNNRDQTKALSNAFAKKGNYAEAYKYFLQYSAYKDSLTLEATSRKVAALEYKQTLLKKEAEIGLLTKDRLLREQRGKRQLQLMFALFGFIALLVTILLVLGRNNRLRKRVNLKLNEQKEELQQALSELKTTQEQLIQSEKMASLGELTAGIAHEIQNPLNFVNNFSEVSAELVRELMDDREKGVANKETETELLTDIEQNLKKISEHGHRASSIIKGMLEHSRTSSGQKQSTNLNALIEEYLKLSYHGLRARDKSFEAKTATDLDINMGNIPIVSQEIGRVLLNIFNNAFYATNQRKKVNSIGYEPLVTVKTLKEGSEAKIIIRDNGKGMPESVKQKIFQPFFTTKPTGEGTGLGLSLSYDVITKGHGGKITVDSKEDDYTEFTITLPS